MHLATFASHLGIECTRAAVKMNLCKTAVCQAASHATSYLRELQRDDALDAASVPLPV